MRNDSLLGLGLASEFASGEVIITIAIIATISRNYTRNSLLLPYVNYTLVAPVSLFVPSDHRSAASPRLYRIPLHQHRRIAL